jgi:hypothetical protein
MGIEYPMSSSNFDPFQIHDALIIISKLKPDAHKHNLSEDLSEKGYLLK